MQLLQNSVILHINAQNKEIHLLERVKKKIMLDNLIVNLCRMRCQSANSSRLLSEYLYWMRTRVYFVICALPYARFEMIIIIIISLLNARTHIQYMMHFTINLNFIVNFVALLNDTFKTSVRTFEIEIFQKKIEGN